MGLGGESHRVTVGALRKLDDSSRRFSLNLTDLDHGTAESLRRGAF